MRNYWLKIAFGALAVFVVGMIGITGIRKAKSSVVGTLDSTDPITIPTPFVNFKLDGRKLGDISKVILLRNDPNHIASVTVVLKVADSLRSQLSQCILTTDNVDQLNDKSTFRCQHTADTAGLNLSPFGRIAIKGTADTFALLLPQEAIRGIQNTSFKREGHGMKISDESDSLREVNDSIQEVRDSIREAIHDSLSAAADRMSDSMQTASERLADSLTEAALKRAGGASAKGAAAPVAPPRPGKPAAAARPKAAATTVKP